MMMNVMKKWDAETTLRFVKLYAKHTCMWDKTTPEYKNPLAREYAIQDIIEQMGISEMTIEDVKSKIRIIRNAYINEKKKIRNRKRMSIDGQQIDYVCKLSWFPIADQFLSKVVRRRLDGGSCSRLVSPEEHDIYHNFIATNDEYGDQHFSDNSSARSHDENVEQDELFCDEFSVKMERKDDSDSLEMAQNDLVFELSRFNEENRVSNDHYILQENGVIDERAMISYSSRPRVSSVEYVDEEVYDQKPAVEELGEFDMFAKNIALQLKQLPLEKALEVQKKIHDLLLNERLKIILQKNSK